MSARAQQNVEWSLGVLAVLCIMIASVTIDTTTAWGLATNLRDQFLIVAAVLGAWLWKAIGSIKIRQLWLEGRYFTMIVPTILIGIAIAMSGLLEGTFYFRIFGDSHEARAVVADKRASIKREIDRLDRAITDRGTPLSDAEVNAQVATLLAKMVGTPGQQKTVGELTKNCTVSTHPAFAHCGEVLALKAKAASGETQESLIALREKRQAELEAIPVVANGNGIVVAMKELGGFSSTSVMMAISAMAMLLNLLGCVSLPYVLLTARDRGPASHPAARPPGAAQTAPAGDAVPDGALTPTAEMTTEPDEEQAAAMVAKFVSDYLVASKGGQVPFADLHEVFTVAFSTPWTARFFGTRLHAALRRAGIEVDKRRVGHDGMTALIGISLTDEGRALLARVQQERSRLITGRRHAQVSKRFGVLDALNGTGTPNVH